MNSVRVIMYFMLATLMILSPLHSAMADDDYIEARRLLDAGEILPLEVILKDVRKQFPGNVLDIELEREGREIVYEVEVLGEDSVIREVYIDARTGKVLSSEEDY